MKLPTSALRQEGKGSAVWVLDKATMTVRSQPVQVATADGNEAVIASGIAPGMMVVAAGVHVLQPGQKVTIYQSKEAAAAAANAGAKDSAQPVTAVAATNKEIAAGAGK
jgi:multidrug efflux system membrane fusion protein